MRKMDLIHLYVLSVIAAVLLGCATSSKEEPDADDAIALVERLTRYEDNPSMSIFGPSPSFLGFGVYKEYEESYSNLKSRDEGAVAGVSSVNIQDPNMQEQLQSDLEAVRKRVKETYQMLYEISRCDKKEFKVVILKDCPLAEEQRIAQRVLDKWDQQTESLKRVDGGQTWSNLNEYFYSDFHWLREDIKALYKK